MSPDRGPKKSADRATGHFMTPGAELLQSRKISASERRIGELLLQDGLVTPEELAKDTLLYS